MKINAIGPDYSVSSNLRVKNLKNNGEPGKTNPLLQESSMISFKSGNPKHLVHIIAEEPLFNLKNGGVGTVSNDYNFMDKDLEKVVKVIPLYNQEVTYKENIDPKTGKTMHPMAQDVKIRRIPQGLPADHPFKGKEGTAFVTGEAIDSTTNLADFLKNNEKKVFLLDEVKSSKMDWGFEKDIPIKMFKVQKNENFKKLMTDKGYSPELQNKLDFVFTYVDSVSSMKKPYDHGNAYATASGAELEKRFSSGWKGQEYAKWNKACVELLPGLKEKYNIDPGYILCSDGQSMFTMHYAAQKNAAGDSYWADKFLGGVGHNMNRGYIQEVGARQAIVNLGATKEELQKLVNSKEYLEALQHGREEDFLKETVLKNFYNPKTGMSSYTVPVHYAKKGYVPMLTTVSEGYFDSVINNELVSPLYHDLKELASKGLFKGLLNPLMDPTVSGFSEKVLQAGYAKESRIKLADGTEVKVPKFQIYDSSKKYDLKHIREIKRQNKINLFERCDKKFIGSQLYDAKKNDWGAAGSGQMNILAGAPGRNAKIYGEIDKKYIEKLKKGEDVKLIASWGRGDFQKGMDTVIESFEKYASKDPNAILIFGGDMKDEQQTVELFKSKMYQPELKGRMLMMDGFAPGKDFSMAADVALLPSRFAPCELTDLEAKKCLCTPIVPNVQGMAQKDFDPSVSAEAKYMDSYKGKHEFFMTEKEAYDAANENAKKEFKTLKDKLIGKIKKEYTGKLGKGKEIPAELLKATLEGDAEYDKALRKLRDSVISDEMASCLERALITDRNTDVAKNVLKNQVDLKVEWYNNGWLSKTGKSSGDLYAEYHYKNKGKNIGKSDLIKLDFSGLTDVGTSKKSGNSVGFMQKIKNTFKGNKTATILSVTAAGVAVLGGLGYYGKQKGWFSPKFEEEKQAGHLSEVG